MRTIKFRSFSCKTGTWYYLIPGKTQFTGNDLLEEEDWKVMQFTGLQDKNGADIYEGDILDGDGIVEWNDVEFCWSVKDKGYDGVDQWHSLQFKNCPIEITGNIHEGGINVL